MLVAETAMFAFIWYKMYVPELEDKFWNRGNWAVIGMYALVLFLFYPYILGGYRIGYLRITDICLSQILGILFANIIEYFQICMIANDYMSASPLLLLTTAEIAVTLPTAFCCKIVFMSDYIRQDV